MWNVCAMQVMLHESTDNTEDISGARFNSSCTPLFEEKNLPYVLYDIVY